MRRVFELLVAASVGVWADEILRAIYRHTMHAPRSRALARVVPIHHGRFHR